MILNANHGLRGGVRGVIELAILREIEKALGDHVPIQNFFDLIVGTRLVTHPVYMHLYYAHLINKL